MDPSWQPTHDVLVLVRDRQHEPGGPREHDWVPLTDRERPFLTVIRQTGDHP